MMLIPIVSSTLEGSRPTAAQCSSKTPFALQLFEAGAKPVADVAMPSEKAQRLALSAAADEDLRTAWLDGQGTLSARSMR
jgi:hypothetical protein